MVAKLTWLCVMVHLMVMGVHNLTIMYLYVLFCTGLETKICSLFLVVTGLHDMDEFVQSQLILAVSP